MLKKNFVIAALFLCMLCLSSCSVLMVKNMKEQQSKSAQDHVSWTQEELEKYYGSALATTVHDDGSKTCVYEFKTVYFSYDRIEYNENLIIFTDAITLGLWEIFSTPVVLVTKNMDERKASKTRVWVTYDADGKVKFEKQEFIE